MRLQPFCKLLSCWCVCMFLYVCVIKRSFNIMSFVRGWLKQPSHKIEFPQTGTVVTQEHASLCVNHVTPTRPRTSSSPPSSPPSLPTQQEQPFPVTPAPRMLVPEALEAPSNEDACREAPFRPPRRPPPLDLSKLLSLNETVFSESSPPVVRERAHPNV